MFEKNHKKEIYKSYPNWIIMKQCNRGYEPYLTLHKKRRLFGFEWNSDVKKWVVTNELHKLEEFILKWEGFLMIDLKQLDYGDFVNELTRVHKIDAEQSFYFFEECENKPGFFNDCRTYDDAIKKVVNAYKCELIK